MKSGRWSRSVELMPRCKPSTRYAARVTAPMTGARFRVIRERLGLTVAWLAQELDVRESTVEHWEKSNRIPPGVVADLCTWIDEADQLVNEYAIEAKQSDPPALTTYRTNGSYAQAYPDSIYPASWHRAIVGRVLERIPDLEIRYAD